MWDTKESLLGPKESLESFFAQMSTANYFGLVTFLVNDITRNTILLLNSIGQIQFTSPGQVTNNSFMDILYFQNHRYC